MNPKDIKLNRTQRRAIMRSAARKAARQRAEEYREAERRGMSRDVMLAADAARKAVCLAAEAAAV